jgi:RNA polymerase sigma factor (sigma-70 family)
LTERELIEGCIKQRYDCQKLLYQRFSGKMISLCLRYTNQQQEAEDVFQEGFIKVFEYLHQFKFEGSFEGWLRRIFVTVAIRHVSKRKLFFEEVPNAEAHVHAVEPAIVAKISEDEIHQLIRSMPDGYRTIFNLNIIEGYTHDEIAQMLGIQATTSRGQLLKARKHLQQLISKKQNTLSI